MCALNKPRRNTAALIKEVVMAQDSCDPSVESLCEKAFYLLDT